MGGRAAMQKGSAFVRPVHVTIRIGDPIETRGLSANDRDDVIARVRQRIADLLAAGPVTA
jgi:1-acyl-sn-glycerol-3-phosphate acyltransferase